MSNSIPPVSKEVEFAIRVIAALDPDNIEELAMELSNDPYDGLVMKLLEAAQASQEVHGYNSLFAEVAKEYRRERENKLSETIECDIPDFDDPDFEVKLYTDNAPLDDRKRLFVRLWNTFEFEDKRAFLSRADPNRAFQRAA